MSEVKRYDAGCNYAGDDEMVQNKYGDYVTYDDYAALQQKLEAVLAENAEIKSGIADITFMRDDDFFASTQEAQRVMGNLVNIKTPTTDAILNEVRAKGKLEVLSELAGELDARMKNINTTLRSKSFLGFAWAAVETKRAELSNSLRSGSKEGGV